MFSSLFTAAGEYLSRVKLMSYGALLDAFGDISCNGFPQITRELDDVIKGIWHSVKTDDPLLNV